MSSTNLPLDGYGVPFDPEKHLEYVRAGVASIPPDTPRQVAEPEWKDAPAGHYDKGSGV